VLNAGDYREACDLREKIEGKKMSKQAWAIVDKIKEVDVLLRAHPRLTNVIHEVHPEVSFCLMGNNQPNYYSKKKNQGMEERIWKLSLHFKIDDAYVKRISIEHKVFKDDIADALAALWSADRIFQRKHLLLPAVDTAGQPRIYA
jgi:predicted RNase H-like nuclease